MNLGELIRDTDALTYANALKVTQTEIKDEISNIEEMISYINQAVDRVRKLVRKADNQYRIVAKIAQKDYGSIANELTVVEDMGEDPINYEKLMEET